LNAVIKSKLPCFMDLSTSTTLNYMYLLGSTLMKTDRNYWCSLHYFCR